MRVHDVRANVRVARMSDAIVRGWQPPDEETHAVTDRPDTILLQGMRFEGRHGASDEERALPQLLEVDLVVEADLRAAGRSDDLADTVDYGPLVELCRATVETGSFRLLEAIAGDHRGRVLAMPGVLAVTVRVRKLAVPIDADLDFAQVEIRRSADPPTDVEPRVRPVQRAGVPRTSVSSMGVPPRSTEMTRGS